MCTNTSQLENLAWQARTCARAGPMTHPRRRWPLICSEMLSESMCSAVVRQRE